MAFRRRSYNISGQSERKTSSSAVEGSGLITDTSSGSTSTGHLGQSSNDTDLGVNNNDIQEPNTEATCLGYKKLDGQEELGDDSVNSAFSETMDTKYQDNEPGKYSDDQEIDEEKVSEKENKQPEKLDEWYEDGNTDSETSKEPVSNVEEIMGNDQESLRLSLSDNEEADVRESPSDDDSNHVSTSKVKMSLDIDNLEEGNSYTEREIYETQLVQLQQQLVETMIKEQESSEKLKKLENLKLDVLLQELEEEKTKTSELTDQLVFMKNKTKNSSLRRSNASRRVNRRSRNLETSVNQKESVFGAGGDRTSDADNQQEKSTEATPLPNDDTPVFNFDEGHFAVAPDRTEHEGNTVISSSFAVLQEYKKMIVDTIVDRLWDFVNEDPSTMKKKDDDGDALSVITLKENINRCKTGAQPIARFVQPVIDVFTWSSPVASVMTFLVYVFAVIHGFLLPLIILMVILQLSSNYFYASGLAERFRLQWKDEPPPPDDKTMTDRFQLVLQVAKKVQNVLGEVADSLEKMKNLLTWQHPATNKLFILLCLIFIASSLFDGPTLFRIAGVVVGIKLFIVRPIYTKFPKVKRRYDGLARLWKELPTDADLAKQKKKEFYFSTDTDDVSQLPKSPKLESPKFVTSWIDLCARMKIPLTEYPVPSWEEGHRCTLMTKDKPLTKMKQGKLFLTQNYLCFERYKFGISKHVVIKLEDIINAEKYKPMNIMPGTGKSMKIEIKGSYKPYIFGALYTRDELFESLIATCKAAKVPWACERMY